MIHVSPYPMGMKPKHNFSDKMDRFEGKKPMRSPHRYLSLQQKPVLMSSPSGDASSHTSEDLSPCIGTSRRFNI